jgi:hypothetical protein
MVGPAGRNRRRYQESDRDRYDVRRNRRRNSGCLFYAVVFLIVMVILAILFGGFHKGTKYTGGLPARPPIGASQPAAYPKPEAPTAWI